MPIKFSIYSSLSDARVHARHEEDWDKFCQLFAAESVVRVPTKNLVWDTDKGKWEKPTRGLPMFSPAHFRPEDSAPHGKRSLKSHEGSSVLGLDYDAACDETLDEVCARFEGCRAIVHSTFNYTSEHKAFRVLLACSRDVNASEYERLVKGTCNSLDGKAASSVCDASRLWFGAAAPEGSEYHVRVLDGEPLDVDALLPSMPVASTPIAAAIEAPTGEAVSAITIDSSHPEYATRVEWFRQYCRTCAPPSTGGQTFAIAERGTRKTQLPADVVSKILKEEVWQRCAKPVPETEWHKVERIVKRTITTGRSEVGNLSSDYDWRAFSFDAARASQSAGTATAAMPAKGVKPIERLGFEYGAWENEPPPTDFLVDRLLPRGCVGMIFARADSLKTWLLFSLAIALANGKPWLDHFHVKQAAKVGIVDFETGRGNVGRRLYMLRAGKNERLGSKSFSSLKPNDPKFWAALELEGFELVVVDSLRKANPGANENDSAEAIRPLELAAEFSERTGCAVLFIHHAKKSSEDGWPEFRGSGAIEDQVDVSYAVRKTDVSPERKTVEVKCIKPGDMRMPDPFVADIVFDDVARTATVSLSEKGAPSADTKSAKRQAQIKELLAQRPCESKRKIENALGLTHGEGGVDIDALVVRGEVIFIKGTGYELDWPKKREERILAALSSGVKHTTAGGLARAAQADEATVQGLLRQGVICQLGRRFETRPTRPTGG